MEIILCSNDCPRCRVLKKKLIDKGAVFDIQSDESSLRSMGFTELPVLIVSDGVHATVMPFADAVKWVNGLPGGDSIQDDTPHFCATCRIDPDSDRR